MSRLSDCGLTEKQINERVLKFGRREPSKGGRMIVVTDMYEWSDGTTRLEQEPFEDELCFDEGAEDESEGCQYGCGDPYCEQKAKREVEEIRLLIGTGIAY